MILKIRNTRSIVLFGVAQKWGPCKPSHSALYGSTQTFTYTEPVVNLAQTLMLGINTHFNIYAGSNYASF